MKETVDPGKHSFGGMIVMGSREDQDGANEPRRFFRGLGQSSTPIASLFGLVISLFLPPSPLLSASPGYSAHVVYQSWPT